MIVRALRSAGARLGAQCFAARAGVRSRAMGKTAKRQNKRAAAHSARAAAALGARGGTEKKPPPVGSSRASSSAAAAAVSDAMAETDASGGDVVVDPRGAVPRGAHAPPPPSLGRVARACEAELTQEACVALDALLAETERGERGDAPPLALCTAVLALCQKNAKAKPALRLLRRMELCGLPVGPVQLRQVFFACCARGMVPEALALMARREPETPENAGSGRPRMMLGKDVLVRGCGLVPGGDDSRLGMALLEGTLRGIARGSFEMANPDAVRVTTLPAWTIPAGSAAVLNEASDDESAGPETFVRPHALPPAAPRGADPAAHAARLAPLLYPEGDDGAFSFYFLSDDDGRRRPADRAGLELWAPSRADVLPLEPPGLADERVERWDLPTAPWSHHHRGGGGTGGPGSTPSSTAAPLVPGAFALSNVLTRRETAALRAAAHAVGWRRDAPDPRAPEKGRLDYCEVMAWNGYAERIWRRIAPHVPAGARGINPRLRFFRYGPETIYRRHVDGSWPAGELTDAGEYAVDASEGKRRSKLTLLLYLSEGFDGGATTFYDARGGFRGVAGDAAGAAAVGEITATPVLPREGAALCFPHGDAEESPVHEGSSVRPGRNGERWKYVIRTDVMFEA